MIAIESLNGWGAAWASFMVRALVDSTALLVVLGLIWLPLRRRISAQFAHGLFLLVLLKLALPIPTDWPTWSADASVRRAVSGWASWATPQSPLSPVEVAEPILTASNPEPIVAAAAAWNPEPPALTPRPAGPPTAEGRSRPRLTLRAALMLAWAAVTLVLLARFARSVAATRRLIRDSLPVPADADWFPVDLDSLRRTAGVRLPVRWVVSPEITSPAVGGLLRPTVVMPPDLDDGLTPKQLHWILLHELAHIRRGDLWVVIIQRVLGSAFFFHPAVHLANWAIDQLREYACDDAALAASHASRVACGEGFLAIVGRTVDHAGSPSPALGLFESRMLIHRRLLRILDARRTVHDRLSTPATLALVALALVALPYGHPRDAGADVGSPIAHSTSDRGPLAADEPRQFAPGATILHDDRAEGAGKGRSPVLAIACSPDGRTLADAGEDGTIVLRDPATGAVRARLEGHADAVTCLDYSPDGRTLASAGYDRTVRLWDNATGAARGILRGHSQWVFALAFAPDGRTLASAGSDRTVRLWDFPSGRERAVLVGPTSAVRALAYSPDGRSLASAGADRVATLWDLATGRPSAALGGHRGTIRALAFGPDGRTLASAGEDGEVKLWDPASGRERATLTGHSDMVLALAFTPSGATLASGGLDSTIRLWDPASARERATLAGHSDGVSALRFEAGARRLAAAGYDGTINLWEAAAPTLAAAATFDYPGEARGVAFGLDGHTLHATGSAAGLASYDADRGTPAVLDHPGGGASLAVSPDGRTVALGGLDGRIRLVDAATRAVVATLARHEGEVRALAFDRRGRSLASGGLDGRAIVWEVGSRTVRAELPRRPGPVASVAFGPDGATLAVAAAGGIELFEAGSGRALGALGDKGRDVAGLAYSPDGRTIAAVGPGGAISLFDAASRAERAGWSQPGGRSLAFGADGRFLATGHDGGEVILWDAGSGVRLATLKGHGGPVASLAFGPDGRTIASACRDRTVRLWDLAARKLSPKATLRGELACVGPVAASPDGRTLASAEVAYDSAGQIVLWYPAGRRPRLTLSGHARGVTSIAFAPDGRTLASSSWDLSIRLWDAATGASLGEFATTEAAARLAFSPDGRTLAVGSEDRTLTLWDVEGRSEVARAEGFRGPIYALAFSPDGSKVATGGGLDGRQNATGEVKVFDARSLRPVAELAGPGRSVRALAFAPDGRTLAGGGVDATVRLWDVGSGRPELVVGGFPDCIRALGFGPDGRNLAVAGRADGVLAWLDARTGAEVARLVGHSGPVLGLCFSPDGRTLASGSLDATIKLWDLPARRPGTLLARSPQP